MVGESEREGRRDPRAETQMRLRDRGAAGTDQSAETRMNAEI